MGCVLNFRRGGERETLLKMLLGHERCFPTSLVSCEKSFTHVFFLGELLTTQTLCCRTQSLRPQLNSKSLCSGFGVLKNPKLPEMSGSGISTLLFLVFRHSCPLILILRKPYRYSSQTALGNVFALPWQRNQTQSVKVRRYCTVADAPADFSQCPMNGDWRHDK